MHPHVLCSDVVCTVVLDADSERCVEILDAYITELRVYMKKFPWTTGVDAPPTNTTATPQQQDEEWDLLSTEVRSVHVAHIS